MFPSTITKNCVYKSSEFTASDLLPSFVKVHNDWSYSDIFSPKLVIEILQCTLCTSYGTQLHGRQHRPFQISNKSHKVKGFRSNVAEKIFLDNTAKIKADNAKELRWMLLHRKERRTATLGILILHVDRAYTMPISCSSWNGIRHRSHIRLFHQQGASPATSRWAFKARLLFATIHQHRGSASYSLSRMQEKQLLCTDACKKTVLQK